MIKTLGFASGIPGPCVEGSAFFRSDGLHSTHNHVDMNSPVLPKRIAEGISHRLGRGHCFVANLRRHYEVACRREAFGAPS